jgi:hypothetical protein
MSKQTTHDLQMASLTVEWQSPATERARGIENIKQLIADKQREIDVLMTRLNELDQQDKRD